VKHLSGAPLKGRLLALPTNNVLGWKGLQGANALAYSRKFVTYGRKKFYNIDTWWKFHKTFSLPQML
jgi:hypothetical protein